MPRERVLRSFRDAIGRGHLKPGERLASETAVATEHGVSRGTVRAALAELEQEGLIVSRKNCGRIVASAGAGHALLSQSFLMVSAVGHVPELVPGRATSGDFELGVMTAASEAGLHPVVLNKAGFFDGYFESLLNGNPVGVLVCDGFYEDEDCHRALNHAYGAGRPIAVYGDHPSLERYDRVISDHETGAAMLAGELLRRGCRNVLRVWTMPETHTTYWREARNRGFETVMRDAGLQPPPALYAEYMEDRDKGRLHTFDKRVRMYAGYLTEHLLDPEPIDGLMLTTDSDFFPAAAACRLFGKTPGRDIMLAGYDNYWSTCDERELERSAPTATVDRRGRVLGTTLFSMLKERIDAAAGGDAPTDSRLAVIPPRLVVTE